MPAFAWQLQGHLHVNQFMQCLLLQGMYFEGKGQLKEANEVYTRFQNQFPDHELLDKRKVWAIVLCFVSVEQSANCIRSVAATNRSSRLCSSACVSKAPAACEDALQQLPER